MAKSNEGGNMDNQPGTVEVFARYITKNGKRIYPKRAKYFHFYVKKKPAK